MMRARIVVLILTLGGVWTVSSARADSPASSATPAAAIRSTDDDRDDGVEKKCRAYGAICVKDVQCCSGNCECLKPDGSDDHKNHCCSG